MKSVAALLKKHDNELDELVKTAFVYLQAYKDTGDWGYIPTVKNCIDRISFIHMRESKNGSSSSTD